ncbi:MAG: hypothetical protein JJE45_04245 [Prolixibacteraceae bacterium]|nr:hypothetical protein [Prolixibacteraceae bacterium]
MEIKLDRIIYRLKKLVFCFFLLWFSGIGNIMGEGNDTLKTRKSLIFSGYAQYGEVLATNPYLKQDSVLLSIGKLSIHQKIITTFRWVLIKAFL